METENKRTDWLFVIGLPILILGYLALMMWIYLLVVAIPVYFIGVAMIVFSNKSLKVKLWIIIPTFFLNTTAYIMLSELFGIGF